MDKFVWWRDEYGSFVKETSNRLNNIVGTWLLIEEDFSCVLKHMWKTCVPSNIQIFVRRILLTRLQTQDELEKQWVIRDSNDLVYPLHFGPVETY